MSHILYFTCLVFLFFSCEKNKKDASNTQEVRINIGAEPNTLDPRKARDLYSQTVTKMLFEGLYRIDKSGQRVPALVKDVTLSEDLKTYTFTLKNSLWSDGTPLTAEDFAYGWRKILDSRFLADYAFLLYPIKNAKEAKEGKLPLDEVGIKVIKDDTLVVELERPTPYFLDLIAMPLFSPIPKHIDQENSSWASESNSYVSNGPFKMSAWKHNDFIKLTKNEKYWDAPNVSLKNLSLYMVKEETEYLMFEKKELDWAGGPLSTLPLDLIPYLKKKKSLCAQPLLGTYFLRSNVEKKPFDLLEMRKAFALAIDRESLTQHILNGAEIPATSLVPPCMGLRKKPYFQDGDDEEALDLFEEGLKKGGFKRETLPEITLTYRASERGHLIAQALQQDWLHLLGIEVKLQALETKVYFDRVSKKDYHLAFCSWFADFEDPINFLSIFKDKRVGTNNTNWEHPTFTLLLNQSDGCSALNERKDLLTRAEQILIDEMPIIPLYHSTTLYLKNDRLEDVVLSPTGLIDFKWAKFKRVL